MSLEWWEYYEVKGNLRILQEEVERLTLEIQKLREDLKELKKEK